MAYDIDQLLDMSASDLDELFRKSPPGPIPEGTTEATAIVAPGTKFSREIAKIMSHFRWHGTVFDSKNGTLCNRVTIFGFSAIVAEVYIGDSLIDGKPSIVLDYSKTSTVAERIRDEIRMIADKTYLGLLFWNDKPKIYFALHFT